jgi:hypothetical protein
MILKAAPSGGHITCRQTETSSPSSGEGDLGSGSPSAPRNDVSIRHCERSEAILFIGFQHVGPDPRSGQLGRSGNGPYIFRTWVVLFLRGRRRNNIVTRLLYSGGLSVDTGVAYQPNKTAASHINCRFNLHCILCNQTGLSNHSRWRT